MSLEHFDIRDGSRSFVEGDAAITDALSDDFTADISSLSMSRAEKLERRNRDLDSDGEVPAGDPIPEARSNPEVKRHDIELDLDLTNPRYLPPSPLLDGWEERQYQQNCQRCVPAYEMRCRGFDVEAQPLPAGHDKLSKSPELAWEDPDVCYPTGTGMEDIVRSLEEWGPGSRAEVIVFWRESPNIGHAFMAENDDGEVRFIDPQNADADCSWYFDNVAEGETRYWRTDNLEPSEWMAECCKERYDDDYLQ